MARKQSSTIYYRGNKHKEIYYQGHYHDKMYLGGQLIWEKLKSASLRLAEFYSFIEYKDTIYCFANLRSNDWEGALHDRWYICTYDAEKNKLIPIANVAEFNDDKTVYMRDVGENGFLCYIKTTKSIKTAVVSVDSEGKSQIVYTDEKKPKFPCYFLKTTDGKTEMKFAVDEKYYYDSTKATVTGDDSDSDYPRYYFVQRNVSDETVAEEILMIKGSNLVSLNTTGNIVEYPAFVFKNNVYVFGWSDANTSQRLDSIFVYGDSHPVCSLSHGSSFSISQIVSDTYCRSYYVTDDAVYMTGRYYDESSYKMAVYAFDGSGIKALFTAGTSVLGTFKNVKKIGNSVVVYSNYSDLSSSETSNLKIGVYKDGQLNKIDIAPLRNITHFCGVFGNEEYICAAVYLRYMYQDLPNGLYIVRISQETLEIVDFINPTIDERKL